MAPPRSRRWSFPFGFCSVFFNVIPEDSKPKMQFHLLTAVEKNDRSQPPDTLLCWFFRTDCKLLTQRGTSSKESVDNRFKKYILLGSRFWLQWFWLSGKILLLTEVNPFTKTNTMRKISLVSDSLFLTIQRTVKKWTCPTVSNRIC